MKFGRYSRNLLLAATIVSLSTTIPINIPVQAETLVEAIANATTPSYTMDSQYQFDTNAGTLAGEGRVFTIYGNDNKILGNSKTGINVSEGQTLTLNNVRSYTGTSGNIINNAGTVNIQYGYNTEEEFDWIPSYGSIDNSGTLNITNGFVGTEGSGMSFNSIKNTGTLNITEGSKGIEVYGGITDNATPTGVLNLYSGGIETQSLTQKTINLKGGSLTVGNVIGYGTKNLNADIVVDGTQDRTGKLTIAGGVNGTISGTFKGNQYGALSINTDNSDDFVLNGVNFDSNRNNDYGVVTFSNSYASTPGNFILNNNQFTNNYSVYYNNAPQGGVLRLTTKGESGTQITNGIFTGNHVDSTQAAYGGAIFIPYGNLTITNTKFTDNYGIGRAVYGGAIVMAETWNMYNNPKATNYTITGTITETAGVKSSTTEFKNNIVTNQTPTSSVPFMYGGSIFTLNGLGTIDGVIFDGNKATTTVKGDASGGAIYNTNGTHTIKNSIFRNNEASVAEKYYQGALGGAIYQSGGTLTIEDSIFTNNIAENGAAIFADSANITIYAKNSNVEFTNNNSTGTVEGSGTGIEISGGSFKLNADTGHNITINDAVYSTTGMTINDGHAGTVALNGTLTLGGDAVISGGRLKLNSAAAESIANANLKLNGGKFDIANNVIDNLTFTNAINNAVNSSLALDVSLGDTNIADKITSDISGASTIFVSDINFISDNKNGGEVQIADGNIKSAIAISDVAGGYADAQYNNSTGVLSFADKIDWLQQTNGSQSGYRFTKTNNGIMPVNYTSGENNYTFYTDILRKNYVDNNSVAHDLKYTWNNTTHALTVTNSDDTAVAQTTMARTGAGSAADPYVLTGDYTGNSSSLGFARWDRVGSITGDFIANTKGGIGLGMGITIGDITGDFIGNSGGRAFSFSGDHSWSTNINSITGDFIGNTHGAIYIFNWNNGGIGTVKGDFIGNKDDGSGGAIALADSHINSVIGNFVNNYAGDVGGALLVGEGKNGANISVTGDFIANQAVNKGGAVYNGKGATTRLIDSSFIGNIAPVGAAIYLDKGELTVTAQNKDIEFTNNNSTGLAGGDGYGIYHKSSGYRPFAINAYEGRTITVNDKVYSEQKINLNCYYSGDWVGKNGTVIFNNEFTQTGATEISSNESNAGGGTVIFNGTTSLADLDVSGTATLKLGAGAGNSTFGAVTFSRSPILDIANNSAQTLTVASIKNNAKLNIDLDFTGDSVLADAINITTGGKTGVLTINNINALTSETGAIREFADLEILKGTTANVTLALSEAIQSDEKFFGDEVESVTREVNNYTDTANFGEFAGDKFTDTVYAHKTQKQLYLNDAKTTLSFSERETATEYIKTQTVQDVLQALNQSTSATRSLTTDSATATYTADANLGTTGAGSLSVVGATSGENISTLNMNTKSGFELSNANTTLSLSNLNITGVKDVEGGLISITGENSKANLENVTIAATTNNVISNNILLNLSGTNNLGTGVIGTGTTKVTGGETTVGSLNQNAVDITAGNLIVATLTTSDNTVSNAGTLTLNGTSNANTISGIGTTVIAGNINNTGAINQAVEVSNTGTLTSAVDKLGGTITNAGNVLLSGTLNKTIAGAGTTKVNSALTLGASADLSAGTLDLNNGVLTLSGDSTITQYEVNKLTNSGHIKVDIDYTGTPVADSINIAVADATARTITVDDITEIGTVTDSFTVQVLKGATGNITLVLDDELASRYQGQEVVTPTTEAESYVANIDFDKKSFNTVNYEETTRKTLSVVDNTQLKLDTVVIVPKHEISRTSEDALDTLNTTAGSRSMKAMTSESTNAYQLSKDLGNTATGDITVEGRSSSDLGQLDMNGKTGFNAVSAGTTVNLKNLNIINAASQDGSIVNITNSSSSANLDGVTVASNTANVISSNGEVTVKDSSVNAGISNTGTLNFEGTSSVNTVAGNTGTTNIKGQTTVGSLTQKSVDIVAGGKLTTNGNVTVGTGVGEGITNAVDEGLVINGGTFTGNVTGAGSVKMTGNAAIADGSTINQAVNVASGILTTNADGLGGVVTNSGEVSLTGGTLETSVTGGNTTISGNVGVDNTNGSIASAVTVATGGKLTTNASNVTGTINNGGNVDLTGGDIQSAISGGGATTISGVVTNTTNSAIDNDITVAATGDLTSAANLIGGAVTNGGSVQLDGGTLSQTITGGNISIIDDVDTNAGNLAGVTSVASTKELTLTGGDVNSNISGAGNTKVTGTVNNKANISTATEVNGGALDNTNGQLADVTVTSGSLKSNADNISGTVANNGAYEITGGTIANTISGTGDINITGNVVNNAVNTTTGAVSVAAGNELAIGTTDDTFSTASSVTMGDGSTLNLQNGATTNAIMNNLIVATNDTVNVKIDWNDTLNSTSTNIDGKLSITDINMANTTGADVDYTASNLGGKISVSENVNLTGVSASTNNYANYNKTTGELVSYKNSLVKAVDKTASGMSATYVMISDETAGGGELDGTLKVQGNGNSITTGGIVIGSTTIQNADLTLEDADIKNITGDAITVYGGNKGHIVAKNHDVAITANTGNAIKLIANGTNYAEMDVDAGSKTITIDNDITSDDSHNKVTFKGGNVQFNGKFDPAMGVVDGSTVTRSGQDDGIDWTLTSGTLYYTNDTYLNKNTNSIIFNGGNLDTRNGVVTTFNLANMTLNAGANSNFFADVDLANKKMDNFGTTPVVNNGGKLHVAGLNLISDAASVNTSINFTSDPILMAAVDYTGVQNLTALSPIYKYNVNYNSSNGNFDFTRYNSGGYADLNPAIMAAPVAAQLGGYLTQLNSYDEAFRNMDMYMLMTANQRQAFKNKNKIASLDSGVLYDATLMRQERPEGWLRPFATFEKVPLKNGPKVKNFAYGTYIGGESQMYDLGHGWDGMWGAYVGYNGSHQKYDGVSIYQNGGTLGVLGMAYKGNFFTGLTLNAGASGVEASTMYGNEDFAMLMTGIASKTGYNWELFNGKFIVQPSMLMSYSFVNTFDYHNAAGVKIDSDPLHAIQLQPEIKFIGNLKNSWQPYTSVAMVWNIMDDTKFKANDVSLPELSVKPYVKYGVGVRKTWGERLTGFFQTYLTNGGRNGVGLQAGFTWVLGSGKDKKADELEIQKSLNKASELKKTGIVLNSNKV